MSQRAESGITPYLFSIAIGLSVGSIDAVAAQPPTAEQDAAHSVERQVDSVAVDVPLPLNVEDRALPDLLKDLTAHSGVRFDLTSSLRNERVTAVLDGPDWNSAIRIFLKRFNHLAVVDRTGALRRVWITGFEAAALTDSDAANLDDASDPESRLSAIPQATGSGALPVALWRPTKRQGAPSRKQIGERIETDPSIFASLTVGQPLEIPIPQEGQSVLGVVSETHEQLGGEVQVWSGPVDGNQDSASFTISRGVKTTYITVATGSRIYEVSVDNATGVGEVVDEVDMTRGKNGDDIVLAPTGDDSR